MATRSNIAFEYMDGTIKSIYCHNDGYIYGNGVKLLIYYQEPSKVKEMVDLGDMSSLGKNVKSSESHSFNNPQENVCVFYGRDRGESNVSGQVFKDFNEYMNNNGFQEYNYLYKEKNKRWYLVEPNKKINLHNNEESYSKTTLISEIKKVFEKERMYPVLKDELILYLKEQKVLKDYNKMAKELKNKNEKENNSKKMKC